MASLDPNPPIKSASGCRELNSIRRAIPRDMTQALPSLLSEPSADSQIRLVRGPLLFAMNVSKKGLAKEMRAQALSKSVRPVGLA
jgi:hypothetical protein